MWQPFGWRDHLQSGDLFGSFWALGTEKSLPDSTRSCTVSAAKLQPLSKQGRRSHRKQYEVECCRGGASSDPQSPVVFVWRLCARAQGFFVEITDCRGLWDFLLWPHFRPNQLLKGVQNTPCLEQSPVRSWTHCTGVNPESLTGRCICISLLNQGNRLGSSFV